MPRFSFTSSDNVVRVTPRAAAAAVTVNSKGSMHWRSTTLPGWGGVFIGMVNSLLVVIQIVNVECAILGKAEDHAPIGANGHAIETLQLAFERMQPKTRQIHICHRPGRASNR